MLPLHLIIAALFGWLEREQRDVIECLREENRVLKTQLRGRRMRLSDDDRRRLAVIGQRFGRRMLANVSTIVTPDTILRWHSTAKRWDSRPRFSEVGCVWLPFPPACHAGRQHRVDRDFDAYTPPPTIDPLCS
jgi:hypothetical protein